MRNVQEQEDDLLMLCSNSSMDFNYGFFHEKPIKGGSRNVSTSDNAWFTNKLNGSISSPSSLYFICRKRKWRDDLVLAHDKLIVSARVLAYMEKYSEYFNYCQLQILNSNRKKINENNLFCIRFHTALDIVDDNKSDVVYLRSDESGTCYINKHNKRYITAFKTLGFKDVPVSFFAPVDRLTTMTLFCTKDFESNIGKFKIDEIAFIQVRDIYDEMNKCYGLYSDDYEDAEALNDEFGSAETATNIRGL